MTSTRLSSLLRREPCRERHDIRKAIQTFLAYPPATPRMARCDFSSPQRSKDLSRKEGEHRLLMVKVSRNRAHEVLGNHR
jgi:hypothetical protein